MKCALVIPAWVPKDIFSGKTAGSQINYWQPLGTLYVAASLKKAGHEVRFVNGAFLTHNEISRELKEFDPEVVGIYSTAFGWPKAMHMAGEVKKSLGRNVFTVAGGPYPTAAGEKCLSDCPALDAAVVGEGETTFVEILERVSSGKNLYGVKGVVFRDNGRIARNEDREFIGDLDSIPFPARDLLGERDDYAPPPATYKRRPVAVMMTSRGCDRRCIFCFQMDKERKTGIRYRSVENVLEEIELCIKQGYREIKFIDDTFAADYQRAIQIANGIKERNLDFTWFASACVNQVDKPLLKAFRQAGCWAVLLGAESGVQKNLNALKKGITLEQTRKAVGAAKEAGLKVFTPFVFGIPGETFEEGLKTIEFACELDPDIANFHALTPFPGAELYDNARKYGELSEDLNDYTYQGAAFVPYSMKREDVWNLRQIAFKRFYSRPGFLLKRILELRNLQDIKAAFTGAKSLFWIWAKRGLFSKSKART